MRSLLLLVVPAVVAGAIGAGFGYFATKPGDVFSSAFLAMIFGGDAFLGVFLICAGLLIISWLWELL